MSCSLEELRKEVDGINKSLIALFGKRLDITKKIAQIKKENQLAIHDEARENKIFEEIRNMALEHKISPAVMEEIFSLFIHYTKMEMIIEAGYESYYPRS